MRAALARSRLGARWRPRSAAHDGYVRSRASHLPRNRQPRLGWRVQDLQLVGGEPLVADGHIPSRRRRPQTARRRFAQQFASTIGGTRLLRVQRLSQDAELVQPPELRAARQPRHSPAGRAATRHPGNSRRQLGRIIAKADAVKSRSSLLIVAMKDCGDEARDLSGSSSGVSRNTTRSTAARPDAGRRGRRGDRIVEAPMPPQLAPL